MRKKNPFLDAGYEESIVSILDGHKRKVEKRNNVLHVLTALAGTVLAVYLLLGVVFGLGLVNGGSMYPILEDGDLFLYNRLDKTFEIGDIITFDLGGGSLRVKRVVGCEGDTLDLDDKGNLLVNGAPSTVEVFYETQPEDGMTFPYTVQSGEVVVMGDHRSTSADSRETGPLQITQIKGKVIFLIRTSFD